MIEQKTLRKALHLEGEGLHTGTRAAVDVPPAPADTGLFFALTPRSGGDPIFVPATAENIVDTSRATVLGRGDATVSTTEHLLSALFAVGITNAQICVEGPEIPICDGSARGFVDAIEAAGVAPQGRPQPMLSVREPYVVSDADRMVAVLPAPSFRVRFVADFPEPIGTEYFYGEIDPAFYRNEISAARTFGYLHEVEGLRARGLALGGSLDNAVVFAPNGPMQPLRWTNEVVRHKILDLIGDFALLGAWPQCEIVGIKSGHKMHALVTRELRRRMLATPAAS
jgi:UDP-3-O-[3-hydroxymyristoyl] N-acetylglucosamine deacetylase